MGDQCRWPAPPERKTALLTELCRDVLWFVGRKPQKAYMLTTAEPALRFIVELIRRFELRVTGAAPPGYPWAWPRSRLLRRRGSTTTTTHLICTARCSSSGSTCEGEGVARHGTTPPPSSPTRRAPGSGRHPARRAPGRSSTKQRVRLREARHRRPEQQHGTFPAPPFATCPPRRLRGVWRGTCAEAVRI